MAAICAAQGGAQVSLWERNGNIGKKLAITGKGRCNITNMTDVPELVKHMPGNGRFLYSAFSRFSADYTWEFFESLGLRLKVERGHRVFPASDNAHEVVEILTRALAANNIRLHCGLRAKSLAIRDGRACGVYDYPGHLEEAEAVIVATGGVTYPATGSTGDGYELARQAGHSIVAPSPSLVPLETEESWPASLRTRGIRCF